MFFAIKITRHNMEVTRDSTFNMGLAHLNRIDALLYSLIDCTNEENYEGWHGVLCALTREVFFLFNSDEMKKNADLDNACAKAISEYKHERTFEKKVVAYNCLIEYELFIKQQLVQRKMLMSFGRDVRSAIADLG